MSNIPTTIQQPSIFQYAGLIAGCVGAINFISSSIEKYPRIRFSGISTYSSNETSKNISPGDYYININSNVNCLIKFHRISYIDKSGCKVNIPTISNQLNLKQGTDRYFFCISKSIPCLQQDRRKLKIYFTVVNQGPVSNIISIVFNRILYPAGLWEFKKWDRLIVRKKKIYSK